MESLRSHTADGGRLRWTNKLGLVALLLMILPGCGGLHPHRDLLVPQVTTPAGKEKRQAREAVEVTYLGCNGYLIQSGETTLLIDPFFSRPGMLKVALGRPTPTHAERLAAGLARLPTEVDAILVTHAHYDHLMDVSAIRARLGGALIASPTAFKLVGDPGDVVEPGQVRRAGEATIHVYEASHDTICGILPWPGGVEELGPLPPVKAADYLCGQPLGFLIEVGGKSIFIDSGGTAEVLPPDRPSGTDLAILGTALADSRERFIPALERLRPRLTLPSHQDNFFRPLDKSYRFNFGTNFNDLREQFAEAEIGGELVLLDFFDRLTLQ